MSAVLEQGARSSVDRDEQIADLYAEINTILRSEQGRHGDESLGLMATRWYLAQYDELHQALDELLPAHADVLDWGAGVGHFAFVQQRLERNVTAYTLQANSYNCYNDVLNTMAERGGFDVRIGSDPVKLPFSDGSFDAVVSCGVLEHVREFGGDETASLREIRRILRPGGLFVCMHLPNRFSWIEWSNRRLGSSHHRFTYKSEEINQLLAAAQLRLRSHHRYGVLPKLRVGRLLGRGAENARVIRSYYSIDSVLGRVAGVIAQNHFFVAERV